MTHMLLLIPTRPERLILEPRLEASLGTDDRMELCGFGLVAAAARSSQLIAQIRPDRVLLVGIAGTFSAALPIGTAATFDEVACDGIGIGSGAGHQTAGSLGWNHLDAPQDAGDLGGITISDTITVGRCSGADDRQQSRQLLSVAAASGNREEAAWRLQRFPDAAAEDMEGFAVAAACRLADVPLTIVRGISNEVGDRNRQNWQINQALEAAADTVLQLRSTAG